MARASKDIKMREDSNEDTNARPGKGAGMITNSKSKWTAAVEILGWFFAMDAVAFWIFLTPSQDVVQVTVRAALLAAVSLAVILRLARRPLPKAAMATFMLLALAIQSQAIALKVADSTDLLAALFLGVAFLFRGSAKVWWRIFVPISCALLFVPIAMLETRGTPLTSLLRAALMPSLSFLIGSLLAPFVESNGRSALVRKDLRHLAEKNSAIIEQVQILEDDVKDLAMGRFAIPMMTEEFLATSPFRESALIQTLTYSEIHLTVKTVIEELRDRHSNWKTLRLILTSAADLSFPLAVRADRESIDSVSRSLLENALEALGGGEGVVRATLKPSMTFVQLIVEDNGRGLGERAKGPANRATKVLTLIEVRELSETSGWKMEIQARLGVGTRVSLELPRFDTDTRAGAPTARLSRAERPQWARENSRPEESNSLLL